MRQPAEWQQKKTKKSRVEFATLAMLLIPLAVGGFFLFRSTTNLADASPSGSTLSQQILQNASLQSDQTGAPIRRIPERFQIQGTVDDQYTLAVDPKTGETLISDTLGGLGTNNTSIEGDRLRLAKDMLELDQYAEANQGKLTADQYNWLKKVARTGMQLAFGTPGIPPSEQPRLKQELLAEFQQISAKPDASIYQMDKYLALEKTFQSTDEAYLASETKAIPGGFTQYDPVSPPLYKPDPALAGYSLPTTLALSIVEPNMSALSTPTSPYTFSYPYYQEAYYASTLAIPRTSSGTTLTSPTTTTATTINPTTPTLSGSISPNITGKTGGPTVAEYYESILGPTPTTTGTSGSTSINTPTSATISGTTTTALSTPTLNPAPSISAPITTNPPLTRSTH